MSLAAIAEPRLSRRSGRPSFDARRERDFLDGSRHVVSPWRGILWALGERPDTLPHGRSVQNSLIYLTSSGRPPHEPLTPSITDIEDTFRQEFEGMTADPVKLEGLPEA